jgi:hypothetical protein
MPFPQLIKFFACVCVISALAVTSACKKDNVVTTGVTSSTKCDYSPYALGSKFVFQSSTSTTTQIDTITGDTTANSLKYAKGIRTQQASTGAPVLTSLFYRCDANGLYQLADKTSFNFSGLTSFGTTKEIQFLKLPATVGLAWKSDTIKYVTTRGDFGLFYKFQVTALGGSKTANAVVYANDLITVQTKIFNITKINNITTTDSSAVVTLVYDKKSGLIETSQNGTVTQYLKSSIIK